MAEIKKFRGINNMVSPERLRPGELVSCLDMDIDNTGKLMSRRGALVVNGASDFHSLYSAGSLSFVGKGHDLMGLASDLSTTLLRRLTVNSPISYDTEAGVTYYSNGIDTGRLVGQTPLEWGVKPPTAQPGARVTVAGSLPAGRYMYAMTFIRLDGHESGTGLAEVIDLPSGGGIEFFDLEVSTNQEISGKIVYLSTPDGEVLYRAGVVDNEDTSMVYYGDTSDLFVPLNTQFAGPPPPGNMVRIKNGIAYVVDGNYVFYSDPYNFELFRENSFMSFSGQIAVFEPIDGGIFVALSDEGDDGATWFLAGNNPEALHAQEILDFGATPHSAVKVSGGFFGTTEGGRAAAAPEVIWSSRSGIIAGYSGGTVRNMTDGVYSMPVAVSSAAILRQERGYTQYICATIGTGAANNAY